MEYGAERAKATCEAAAVHCVYVDVRDVPIETGWDQVSWSVRSIDQSSDLGRSVHLFDSGWIDRSSFSVGGRPIQYATDPPDVEGLSQAGRQDLGGE